MNDDDDWRYMVTVKPNVSIGPKKYVRVVTVDGPQPDDAVRKALDELDSEDTHLWQSDLVQIDVERVA